MKRTILGWIRKVLYAGKRIVRVLIVSFFCHWVWSIAVCEWRTFNHWEEFYGLDYQTNMIGGAKTVKVLEYSIDEALVYYKDIGGGDVLRFERDGDDWKYTSWNTIWAKGGSADEFMWPYGR